MKLENACPRVPDEFHGMYIRTLNALSDKPARARAKLPAVLAAALLCACLLTGAALAAQQIGLLDKLFGGGTPSHESQTCIVDSGKCVSDNGFTLRLEQYLLDGNALHYSYSISAPDGQQYAAMIAHPDILPKIADCNNSMLGGWSMWAWGAGYGASNKTLSMTERLDFSEDMPTEPFILKLDCIILRPSVPIEPFEYGTHASEIPQFWMPGDRLLTDAGSNLIQLDANEEFYTRVSELGYTENIDVCAGIAEDLGLANRVARLTLNVEISPSAPGSAHLVGADSFEFDEYTLVITECAFTAVEANVSYELWPKRPMEEITFENTDPLWRSYALLMSDDAPVAGASTSGEGGTRTSDDGTVYYVGSVVVHGLQSIPAKVMLVPYSGPDESGQFAYHTNEAAMLELASD